MINQDDFRGREKSDNLNYLEEVAMSAMGAMAKVDDVEYIERYRDSFTGGQKVLKHSCPDGTIGHNLGSLIYILTKARMSKSLSGLSPAKPPLPCFHIRSQKTEKAAWPSQPHTLRLLSELTCDCPSDVQNRQEKHVWTEVQP